MVYQIIYELKTPDMDYSTLYTYLEKEMGTSGIHVLRDCWWVSNPHQSEIVKMCEELRNHMGTNDMFYVNIVTKDQINGWLSSATWKWYSENA